MTDRQTTPPPAGMALRDIYFVLFRHKWKILLISATAAIAAATVYFAWPVPYQSEAKLFVRYVMETKAPTQSAANEPKVKLPSERGGENVINTELEILSSLDLAVQVAEVIGPEKILAKVGGGTNRYRAAALIQGGLVAQAAGKSDVIHVLFRHPDPELVQPVLKQVIETYLTKHAETHRAIGVFDDFLTKQTDQLRTRLSATEEDLHKAKVKAGVLSVEDSKRIYAERMSRIEQAIMEAEAELAERRARAGAMAEFQPMSALRSPGVAAEPVPAGGTNSPQAANEPPPSGPVTNFAPALAGETPPAVPVGATNATRVPAAVPWETLAEYGRLNGLLDALGKRQTELLVQFTPESGLVRGVASQIAEMEKRKGQLEKDNPRLAESKSAESGNVGANAAAGTQTGSRMDLVLELARASALEIKIKKLTEQLNKVRGEATVVSEAEGAITDLERRRLLQEAQFNYFERNLEEARTDEQLGSVKNSDINPIQLPSPPFRDSEKIDKIAGGILFGGIVAAIALAFLIELYLDPSLKRPMEVEARVGLPLFLAIPRLRLNGNGKWHRPGGDKKAVTLLTSGALVKPSSLSTPENPQTPGATGPVDPGDPRSEPRLPEPGADRLAPWDTRHPLRPFHEALRERLIAWFELKNLTHKPKLVGVTSCATGAGVTTVAAGLAASLSETGDGNVLLVDMNHQGAAHQFFRGDLACGLDEALELEKRDGALVQDNLYVVREPHGNGSVSRAMPKHFQHLLPKLRASDYDYIIFDLPPISHISITPRLARFMDVALIVVEAERTDREVVKRAGAMLTQSGASVGVVLNQSRTYVPRRLLQDL